MAVSVRTSRGGLILLLALVLFAALTPGPAAAFDLFARHQVSVEFATADGKPLADAEVRVFAPGKANSPVLTGRTDSKGKFEFPADEDGFWTAEARGPDNEIARVYGAGRRPGSAARIDVAGVADRRASGGTFVAIGVRFLIARRRRPR